MRIDTLNTSQQMSNYSNDSAVKSENQINESIKTESSIKSNKQSMELLQYEASLSAEKIKAEKEHDVIKAIEKANKHIRTYDRKLEFTIHESTKQIMVKVINTEDDTVIREIPSEKVLDMVAHLWEMAGILVDEHR